MPQTLESSLLYTREDGKQDFVHDTYRDFFLAKWFADRINDRRLSIEDVCNLCWITERRRFYVPCDTSNGWIVESREFSSKCYDPLMFLQGLPIEREAHYSDKFIIRLIEHYLKDRPKEVDVSGYFWHFIVNFSNNTPQVSSKAEKKIYELFDALYFEDLRVTHIPDIDEHWQGYAVKIDRINEAEGKMLLRWFQKPEFAGYALEVMKSTVSTEIHEVGPHRNEAVQYVREHINSVPIQYLNEVKAIIESEK